MRYFYDCEFLEDGKTIELISIGIVADNGREYYAVNSAVDDSLNEGDLGRRISNHRWLMENVVPHLPLRTPVSKYTPPSNSGYMPPNLDMRDTRVKPAWVIANEVREFLLTDDHPILWADCGAYDHVKLMQLWGSMVAKPAELPYFTRDLRQAAEMTGALLGRDLKLPEQESGQHDALADARHLRVQAQYLDNLWQNHLVGA